MSNTKAGHVAQLEAENFELRRCNLGLEQEIAHNRIGQSLFPEDLHFRTLFDYAPDGLVVCTPEGYYLDANAAFCKMLGYTRDEVIGLHSSCLVAPSEISEIESALETLSSSSTYRREWSLLRKDGSNFSAEVIGGPLPDGSILAIVRDITERKRADDQVLASELRYRRLFESAQDGILILDADTGMVEDVNPFLINLLGFSHESFLKKKVWELGFLRDIVANESNFVELQAQEYIRFEDKPLETADGRRIDVEFISNVYLVNQRKVIQCNIRDITERKKAEAEAAQLAAIVASSDDAIIGKDLNGLVTSWNPGAEKIFGFSAQEMIGQSLCLMTPPDRQCEDEQILNYVRAGKGMWNFDTIRIRKDGIAIDVSITTSAIKDMAGNVIGAANVARDITERKHAELALRTLNSELEDRIKVRTAALEKASAEAERANRAKSEFLSRMSHELRTPMNSILGYAQLLEMDDPNSRQLDFVSRILKGGRHLLSLIDEVLELSRIEADHLELSLQSVRVADIVTESLMLLQPFAQRAEIGLINKTMASNLTVWADRHRLLQILLNLISNAVKYNKAKGTVTVNAIDIEGETVRIEVSDTGIGIAPETLHNLFAPFERLGADQGSIEGTGLGLAVSQKLCEAMSGVIDYRPGPAEKGSVFSISLPKSLTNSSLEIPPVERVSHVEKTIHGTVLYVEDNLSNVELIQDLLARYQGIKLIVAMQGRLGLDLAKEHKPDLILLDLHLPDVDGDIVLEKLKQIPKLQHIPVIILSANATQRQIDRLIELGACAYFTKPFDIHELLAKIEECFAGVKS